ncbi:MAG: hypothetical protein KGK08_07335 [Acidobacteriota bacterium]|nr:hypothetical protein [Acidobacteriota bacterium]
MTYRTASPATARPQPLWLRLVTLLSILLVMLGSTAQACHHHSEGAAPFKDTRQGNSTTDHCLLCVAMHSAMPTATAQVQSISVVTESVASVALQAPPARLLSFELQSRPPPAPSSTQGSGRVM